MIDRFGLKIRPYHSISDVVGVHYRGLHVFNMPKRPLRWSNPRNTVRGTNLVHPNYHEIIFRARLMWWKIKSTDWYQKTLEESVKQQFDPNYDEK